MGRSASSGEPGRPPPLDTTGYGQRAGGTLYTGMHSCFTFVIQGSTLILAAYVSLCAIILIEFLGLEKLSNSFGFLNMFRGIATFIGAPVAGE